MSPMYDMKYFAFAEGVRKTLGNGQHISLYAAWRDHTRAGIPGSRVIDVVPDEAFGLRITASRISWMVLVRRSTASWLPRTTEVRQRFEHRGELQTITGKNKYKLMLVHDQANCITNY